MTEGRVWICTWKRTKDGYRVWVKKRPRIYAEEATFEEADEALWDAILEAAGDGENEREYDPPRPDLGDAANLQLVRLGGGINAKLLNVDGLTTAGQCPLCQCPRGERNEAPVRVARFSGTEDVGSARTRHLLAFGFTPHIHFYAQRLFELLAPAERAELTLRPIEREGRAVKKFVEIVAAKTVLSFATLEGVEGPRRWRCETCGWKVGSPYYSKLKPCLFVARGDLPSPMPSVFAFADENGWLQLGMTRDRWRQLIGKPGTTGFSSSAIGIVEDAKVDREPPVYLSLAARIAEEKEQHKAERASHEQYIRDRDAAEAAEKAKHAAEWPGLIAAAEGGDADAQFRVADHLTRRDAKRGEALGWARKAADQGHVDATILLSTLVGDGSAGEADPDAALAILERLAEREPAVAHKHLGFLYRHGIVLRRDLEEAVSRYRRAAAAGDAGAARLLQSDRQLRKTAREMDRRAAG